MSWKAFFTSPLGKGGDLELIAPFVGIFDGRIFPNILDVVYHHRVKLDVVGQIQVEEVIHRF